MEAKAQIPIGQQQSNLIRAVAFSKPTALNEFMKLVWGDQQRINKLMAMLSKPAIAENVILTRGVCSEVRTALNHTPLPGLFSLVMDTQGDSAAFNPEEGKWVQLPKRDPRNFRSGRRHWLEIEKDNFIIKNYLPEAQKTEGPIKQILYVDDSPETVGFTALGPEDRKRIHVVNLIHEAEGGVTAPSNADKLAQLTELLDSAPAKSVVAVWDFDCTLSAIHLWKTWSCAKRGLKCDRTWGERLLKWSLAVVTKNNAEAAKKEKEQEQKQ